MRQCVSTGRGQKVPRSEGQHTFGTTSCGPTDVSISKSEKREYPHETEDQYSILNAEIKLTTDFKGPRITMRIDLQTRAATIIICMFQVRLFPIQRTLWSGNMRGLRSCCCMSCTCIHGDLGVGRTSTALDSEARMLRHVLGIMNLTHDLNTLSPKLLQAEGESSRVLAPLSLT